MNDIESKHLRIHAVSARSLAVIGFVFGLIGGLASVTMLSDWLSSISWAPNTITLDSGILSMTRSYPMSAMLFLAWPLISAFVHAVILGASGWVYNRVASRAPLTFRISMQSQ